MKVVLRSVDSIKPYKGNPRINERAVDAVARSIEQFGFRQSIVVDAKGVIIVGHTRWKAAKKLGLKRLPVHVATDLTAAQIRAYRLADNKTAEAARWDPELLPVELKALQTDGFDLEVTGFEGKELAELLGNFDTDLEPLTVGAGGRGAGTVCCPKCGHEFAPGGGP